jgi:predicted dehydrogenase
MSKVIKIGIIGCGNISPIYLSNLQNVFQNVEVKAVADKIHERAETRAREYNTKALSVKELLADSEIEIVVNLTNPDQHTIVNRQIIDAGKSAHSEKPFNGLLNEADEILKMAKAKGVRVGGAPDTFLGAGIQTCRKLLDDGYIGEPVAATAFMLCHGHESWHPDPEFYYKTAAGPMFDMGPYYITALVSLLGPVARVCGSTKITFPKRKITSQPKYGEIIDVDVPTHVAGTMDFASGATATIITSFDVWGARSLPCIEIYGTEGTMVVPDPNTFGGPVFVKRYNTDFKEMPLTHSYADNSRGLAVADLASAIAHGRKHRANDELCYHALEVMHSFELSSNANQHYFLKSTCERPAPMKEVLEKGEID